MALLFMDGFAAGDYATKWSGAGASTQVATATPRVSGGSYLTTSSGASAINRSITAVSEVYAGIGVRFDGTSTTAKIHLYGNSGSNAHITLQRTGAGTLEIRRNGGAGTLLATGTTALSANTWYYLEVRAVIADAGGICQVRINGSSTPDIDFTGDTRNVAATVDTVRVEYGTTGWVTDVYVLDTTGGALNTWLGDVSVRTLFPSGNGTTSQLTGSDGNSTDNYALVDETPVSGTDYVGSATVDQLDTYAMANLPSGVDTVHAVAWNGFIAKSDAGAISGAPVLRTGGTDYTGSTLTLPTSYATQQVVYPTNPAGGSWTPSAVDGLEVGFQVKA